MLGCNGMELGAHRPQQPHAGAHLSAAGPVVLIINMIKTGHAHALMPCARPCSCLPAECKLDAHLAAKATDGQQQAFSKTMALRRLHWRNTLLAEALYLVNVAKVGVVYVVQGGWDGAGVGVQARWMCWWMCCVWRTGRTGSWVLAQEILASALG